MKADEIQQFKSILEAAINRYFKVNNAEQIRPDFNFCTELLQKAKLRGYVTPKSSEANITILVHKCEGRLFLTDRNGFYNDFLAQTFMETKGHTIIILTSNRTPPVSNTSLENKDVITMYTKGD